MKPRSFIIACTAVFLTLIFSLKAGAGLFLHDLLHNNTANKSPLDDNKKENEVSYNCSCIDDFLMPFTAADIPVYSIYVPDFKTIPIFFEENILLNSLVLTHLRGPPGVIV